MVKAHQWQRYTKNVQRLLDYRNQPEVTGHTLDFPDVKFPNRFDRMEWAGAFGTLIPFVVAYIAVVKLDPFGDPGGPDGHYHPSNGLCGGRRYRIGFAAPWSDRRGESSREIVSPIHRHWNRPGPGAGIHAQRHQNDERGLDFSSEPPLRSAPQAR